MKNGNDAEASIPPSLDLDVGYPPRSVKCRVLMAYAKYEDCTYLVCMQHHATSLQCGSLSSLVLACVFQFRCIR